MEGGWSWGAVDSFFIQRVRTSSAHFPHHKQNHGREHDSGRHRCPQAKAQENRKVGQEQEGTIETPHN
jgi:hypothetical protein